MPRHKYTPERALALLRERLKEAPDLAAVVEEAIAWAQAEAERELEDSPLATPGSSVFAAEEQLALAVRALEAHLIELPMFVRSAHEEFNQAAYVLSDGKVRSKGEVHIGAELVERGTEAGRDYVEFGVPSDDVVGAWSEAVNNLRNLTTFGER